MAHQSENIIRNINTNNRVEVTNELEKLWYRERVALTGHFTRRKNILSRLIISTMFGATDPEEAERFDYSTTTKEQLHKAKTELHKSYKKLKHLYDRVKELNPNNEHQLHTNTNKINLTIQTTENTYDNIEIQFGTLKYKLIQQQQQHQPQISEAQFKPVTAHRPNFELMNLAKYNHTNYQRQKRKTGIHKLHVKKYIHKPGITCPRKSSICRNCGIKVPKHMQSVYGKPKTQNKTSTQSQNDEHTYHTTYNQNTN